MNIFCLNTRGLGDSKNRKAVFLLLQEKGTGIFMLQETHSTVNTESDWKRQWDGQIVFSHGLSNSRGVAILFSKNIVPTISNIQRNCHRRFLLIDCNIANKRLIFVNLYAPTFDKKRSKQNSVNSFLKNLNATQGVDILFLLFPASAVRRHTWFPGHFKEKYLSYLYQICYGCLLG